MSSAARRILLRATRHRASDSAWRASGTRYSERYAHGAENSRTSPSRSKVSKDMEPIRAKSSANRFVSSARSRARSLVIVTEEVRVVEAGDSFALPSLGLGQGPTVPFVARVAYVSPVAGARYD